MNAPRAISLPLWTALWPISPLIAAAAMATPTVTPGLADADVRRSGSAGRMEAATTPASWPMQGGNAQRTGRSVAAGPTSPLLKWTYDLDSRLQDNACPIVGTDGTVYVPTEDAFMAINAAGTLRWRKTYENGFSWQTMRAAPALSPSGATVYAVVGSPDGDCVAATDASTGAVLWTRALSSSAGEKCYVNYSSIAVDGNGLVYVGAFHAADVRSAIFAVNPDGTIHWRCEPPGTGGLEAAPAVDPSGSVYFVKNNVGGFTAVDASGSFKWSANLYGGFAWPTPSIGPDGTVFVAGEPASAGLVTFGAGAVRAFNADGSVKWTRGDLATAGWFAGLAVSVDGATVFTGREDGAVYALAASTGATLWAARPGAVVFGGSPVLSANGILYLVGYREMGNGWAGNGHVFALSAADGHLLWQYELNSSWMYWGPQSPALGSDGTLYVVSSGTPPISGSIRARLYAFNSTSPAELPSPTITNHPLDLTVSAGQNASFAVAAVGNPAPSFQWQRQPTGSATWSNLAAGGSYGGTTASRLTISGTTTAMNGDQFRCAVASGANTTTSFFARLAVDLAPLAPTIDTQPASQTVDVGAMVSFGVFARGWPTTFTYQWQRAVGGSTTWANVTGGIYSGATTATLTVTNVTTAMNGDQFRCVVGNGVIPDAASVAATLTVNPSGAPPNDHFANAIMLSGTSIQTAGTNVGATPETGEPSHAGIIAVKSVWWTWTAPASGTVYLSTQGSTFDTRLAVYTGSPLNALTPVAADDNGAADLTSVLVFDAVAGTTYSLAVDCDYGRTGSITLNLQTPPQQPAPPNDNLANAILVTGASTSTSGSNLLATKESGEPNHADDPGGHSVWWRWVAPANTAVEFDTTGSSFSAALAIYTGGSVSSLVPVVSNFAYRIGANTTFWSKAGFAATGGTTYWIAIDGFGGARGRISLAVRPATAPLVVGETTGLSTPAGSAAKITIRFSGTPPLAYQWTRDGVPLATVPDSELTIANVQPTDAGNYVVVGTNFLGSASSSGCRLTIATPLGWPTISTQPANLAVGAGQTAIFTVVASGALPLVHQWQLKPGDTSPWGNLQDGGSSSGATTATLTLNPTALAMNGQQFRCVVGNGLGSVTSNPAVLTVTGVATAPTISAQPTSRTVTAGADASFFVIASGSAPIAYQWQRRPVGLATWSNLAEGSSFLGTRTSSLAISAATTAMSGDQFRCVVSNGVPPDAVSSAATLSVDTPTAAPSITTQPIGQSAAVGTDVTLSVVATGAGASYQWIRSRTTFTGNPTATTPTLLLTNATPGVAGIYECVVSNAAGNALTRPAVVGVNPAPGNRTAGAVATRTEWQDIHHPNGNTYDQFLLEGVAGTFTSDPGQIARMSLLDSMNSIVQVEMSGAGAVTVVLANAAGPMAPTLYNQSGIQYMRGLATIVLAGTDASTHLSVYSVGRLTNPGVTKPEATYDGWANLAVLGVVSSGGQLGGLHLGNASLASSVGHTGVLASNVAVLTQMPVVLHDIAAKEYGDPYLCFAPEGRIHVKIAGGALAQPNGSPVEVAGLQQVLMGAGQDSCGNSAPAQTIQCHLIDSRGYVVTGSLVVGP